MSISQEKLVKDLKGAAICLLAPRWNPQSKEGKANDLVILGRGQTLKFGRSKQCNIILENALISHAHFEIHHDNSTNTITIVDLSKRGTYLNEVNLRKGTATVHEGDVIRVESYAWTLTEPNDVLTLVKGANGVGKVKNSIAPRDSDANMKRNTEENDIMASPVANGNDDDDEIMGEGYDSPKTRGAGIISTPINKLINLFSPRRSSSAVGSKRVSIEEEDENHHNIEVSGGEAINNNMSESVIKETNVSIASKSPRFIRKQPSISSELEMELQHKAKKQPMGKVVNVSYHNVISTTGDNTAKVQRVVKGVEEVSGGSLVVSSNKKIRDIYSTVLEAHSHKDVPTLENLTTDTIHSVIKCAADANEGFQNDLNAVMERTSALSSQFSEASALYEAVEQGKAFPYASSRILKERVRYCAQLETRLKEHKLLYETLLKSRDLMARKLESVRISCGVARSIVAEYQRLYDSVYARINTEIPRPVLDREAPLALKLHKIVLTPEEVKEITQAIHLGTDGLEAEFAELLAGAGGAREGAAQE